MVHWYEPLRSSQLTSKLDLRRLCITSTGKLQYGNLTSMKLHSLDSKAQLCRVHCSQGITSNRWKKEPWKTAYIVKLVSITIHQSFHPFSRILVYICARISLTTFVSSHILHVCRFFLSSLLLIILLYQSPHLSQGEWQVSKLQRRPTSPVQSKQSKQKHKPAPIPLQEHNTVNAIRCKYIYPIQSSLCFLSSAHGASKQANQRKDLIIFLISSDAVCKSCLSGPEAPARWSSCRRSLMESALDVLP